MDNSLRDFIRVRAGHRCEYCQVPEAYDRLPFQPDHIIAEKHGGPTTRENTAWSCFDCNIYKGPCIAGIDSESGEVTRLFHPRKDSWSDHFQWAGGSLIGKTPQGRATIAVLRVNLPRRVAFREQLRIEGVFAESES
ncbi:MAG: HNH endonuclease [Planctomycetales bacterium]|nr:HNH endonuclease [Planctomycetales bacterium]